MLNLFNKSLKTSQNIVSLLILKNIIFIKIRLDF